MAVGSAANLGLGGALRRQSAGFRCPAHLLLPGGCPETARLDQVVALGQLATTKPAAKNGAAMLVDPIAEVLAGHADAGALPVAQLAGIDEVPILHNHLVSVQVY